MSSTPCIRCGKDRVFLKKWTDKAAERGTPITYELYVCPDKDCQKVVDAKFEEMREKKAFAAAKKEAKTEATKLAAKADIKTA